MRSWPRFRQLLGASRRCSGWLLRRWRRSLQVRVAATTALVSAVVVLVIGVVLLGQISGGLLDAKRKAALAEANDGLRTVASQLAVATDADPDAMSNTLQQLVSTLSAKGSNACGSMSSACGGEGPNGPRPASTSANRETMK